MESVRNYEIWSEGYACTGGASTTHYHGMSHGVDFKDVCDNFAKQNEEFARYFDSDRMTYWGCELFEDEQEARRSFG